MECYMLLLLHLLFSKLNTIESIRPDTPHNLTVLHLQSTASLISWEIHQRHDQPVINSFRISIKGIHSPGVVGTTERHLVQVHGQRRTYRINRLRPKTAYEVYIAARNDDGEGNISDTLSFWTLSESEEVSRAAMWLSPTEGLVVLGVILAWCVSFAFFLHKWGTIRILQPNEPRYKAQPPKNIETVKVVKRSTDSVIYKSYSRQLSQTMIAREKRMQRQQTMPNIKLGTLNLEKDKDDKQKAKPKFTTRSTLPLINMQSILAEPSAECSTSSRHSSTRRLSIIKDEENESESRNQARSVSESEAPYRVYSSDLTLNLVSNH